MAQTSHPTLATRLSDIRDVADDLRRELVRLRRLAGPDSAVRDMAAFIKAEAEAVLMALNKPRPPALALTKLLRRK